MCALVVLRRRTLAATAIFALAASVGVSAQSLSERPVRYPPSPVFARLNASGPPNETSQAAGDVLSKAFLNLPHIKLSRPECYAGGCSATARIPSDRSGAQLLQIINARWDGPVTITGPEIGPDQSLSYTVILHTLP
jgi:hypothetical protein